jgi:exo-beta-1,3-glucanase (GH17 family)
MVGSAGAVTGPVKLDGMCFSPYLTTQPGTNLTDAQVGALMDKIKPYTNGIRTFCSDGPWARMPALARARGMTIAAGADIDTSPSYCNVEINGLLQEIHAGGISLAMVGDETLENGLSESTLLGYINTVKAAGIPTATSMTYDVWPQHPSVVAACDVIVMNAFPYWDQVSISDAIGQLDRDYQQVKQVAGGKQIIVETGWPSGGATNGPAVANPANATAYMSNFMSWARMNNVKYYYFEAFDELWKAAGEGEVGVHWGVWDSSGNLKAGMATVFGGASGRDNGPVWKNGGTVQGTAPSAPRKRKLRVLFRYHRP